MSRQVLQTGIVPGTDTRISVTRTEIDYGDAGHARVAERHARPGTVFYGVEVTGAEIQTHDTEAEARANANWEWSMAVKRREDAKREATKPKVRELADGFYTLGDDVYKIQTAVHGSGRQYAKRLVISASGDPGDPDVDGSFEYAPGAIKMLRESARTEALTLERAKELGHLYGVCCRCGRTLTNEASIEAGIGPVCAGKGF